MSVRKAHNSGRNHLRNVVEYYQRTPPNLQESHSRISLTTPRLEIGQENAQSVIDSITASYAAEGQPLPNPAMAPGAFPPPFGFPGTPLAHRHHQQPQQTSLTMTPRGNLGQGPPLPFGMPPPGAPGAPGMPPRMYPQEASLQRLHPLRHPPTPYLHEQTTNTSGFTCTAPGAPGGLPFPPRFPSNASGTPPQGGFPPPLPNLPPGSSLPLPPPGGFPGFPIPPPGAAGAFPPPMPGGPTHSPIPSGPRGSEGYPPPGGGPPPGMDKW
jgi:U1 small nuclear ribonucleoprotein C